MIIEVPEEPWCGDWEFRGGKYEGMTVQEVYDENPEYLDWYVENVDGHTSDMIEEFLEEQ